MSGDSTAGDRIRGLMDSMGRAAVAAAAVLARSPTAQKNAALLSAAASIERHSREILGANCEDVELAERGGTGAALIDRLRLDGARVAAMVGALREVARAPDPIGSVIAEWRRPNGLHIQRIRVPLGVIGIVYESRPNVTADAGALCLKSGNAAILRGGSDSAHSSRAIHACLEEGLREADLPTDAIQLVPTPDRAAVGHMLAGMSDYLDVLVPRGGRSLVERVQREARVPVIGHLEGNCHVFVERHADLAMARAIVLNAKMRRTGICGAAETLLVDSGAASTHLAPLVTALLDAGCEVRGDATTCKVDGRVKPATEADWTTEYLDAIIAVKVVDNVAAAVEHIHRYGSAHTESIVTGNADAADYFLAHVDSAIVLHNASTQFADGGEFGLGAEIGISTDKFHARGPVGVEQLTSYKYVVRGSGQVRP